MNRLSAAFLALLTLVGPTAFGQTKVTVPAVPDAVMDNVTLVVAPQARCAVVNDSLGLLAFAHQPKYTDAQVTLFRIDSKTGQPGEPLRVKLPKPTALAKYPSYVTGLAFHPKLPLLYVWQDIEFPKNEQRVPLPLAVADEKAMAEFDHLLIYNLEKPEPTLVVGLARGPKFAYSRPIGSLAVDAAGERLYVPNIVGHAKWPITTIGSYVLYPDGVPALGEPQENPMAGDRAAHIAAIGAAHAAAKKVMPQRIAPAANEAFFLEGAVGSGIGFVPIGRDMVFTGAFHATGIVGWTPENRQCRLQSFRLSSSYSYKLPAGHPTLPLVFVADQGSPCLYRYEHADGHVTLVPQQANLEGTQLTSAPVMLAKGTKVAVGGTNRLLLLDLDSQGKFKPERRQMLIGNQRVEALAYSEKFDRIYVGVEKRK